MNGEQGECMENNGTCMPVMGMDQQMYEPTNQDVMHAMNNLQISNAENVGADNDGNIDTNNTINNDIDIGSDNVFSDRHRDDRHSNNRRNRSGKRVVEFRWPAAEMYSGCPVNQDMIRGAFVGFTIEKIYIGSESFFVFFRTADMAREAMEVTNICGIPFEVDYASNIPNEIKTFKRTKDHNGFDKRDELVKSNNQFVGKKQRDRNELPRLASVPIVNSIYDSSALLAGQKARYNFIVKNLSGKLLEVGNLKTALCTAGTMNDLEYCIIPAGTDFAYIGTNSKKVEGSLNDNEIQKCFSESYMGAKITTNIINSIHTGDSGDRRRIGRREPLQKNIGGRRDRLERDNRPRRSNNGGMLYINSNNSSSSNSQQKNEYNEMQITNSFV